MSQREAHLIALYSHLTSYVKTTSPAESIASGEEPVLPPHVLSLVSAPFHAPEYVCLMELGSTSKPTMREPCASSKGREARC